MKHVATSENQSEQIHDQKRGAGGSGRRLKLREMQGSAGGEEKGGEGGGDGEGMDQGRWVVGR